MESNELNYMVVIFSHEGEEYVSAAPKEWLRENKTMLWPRNKAIERKAIKLNMKPEEDWITYDNVRIVGYHATLKEALHMEKNKQNSSSSESEAVLRDKGKRKIIPKKKYRDDSISPPPVFEINENFDISSESDAFPTESDIVNASLTIFKEDDHIDHLSDGIATHVSSNDDNDNQEPVLPIQQCLSDISIGAGSGSSSSMNTIMTQLQEIHKFVTYTMRKVEAIELSPKRLDLPSESKESMLPTLPLTELTQLKSLEDKLSNEMIQKELFDVLKHTGGSKERDCVNRCLEKVFTNYLGQYCSWTGKKNNFKLSSLKLMTTLKLAVKQSFPNLMDESFERHVMSWFQHANTRLKRLN